MPLTSSSSFVERWPPRDAGLDGPRRWAAAGPVCARAGTGCKLGCMVARTSLALALAVLLGAAPAAAQDADVPVFRAGTELVDLYVTATDRNGRLVPDLLQGDFVVFDEGQAQEVVLFENEVRPITVVIMLDTSASMTPSLDLLMAGAEQFIIRMLPDDRARVGAFNDKIQILPEEDFTGDRDALIRELDRLQFGNPTRLYDAIGASIEALAGRDGRKVVLVFTDGEDTQHEIGWREVLEMARREEVMIYTIGLESDYFNGVRRVRSRPDRRLRTFAEETGGGYFELEDSDDLGPTFTRVAQELHSQYVLGFVPPARDGRVHEIDVRVNRRGTTARARRSYVAPGS